MRSLQLFVVLLSFYAASADAQWRVLSRPGPVRIVTFLHEFNAHAIGFCGRDDLFRTTDRGVSWTKVLNRPGGSLVDISFSSASNGWALFHNGRVWVTANGGANWTANGFFPVDKYVAVRARQSGKISISVWEDTSYVSTDGGSSWSRYGGDGQNGYAFVDEDHGLVTIHHGKFHVTSNGGATWDSVDEVREAWQPLGIPGTSTFFAASEGAFRILRSDDYGITWSAINTTTLRLSGQIAGRIGRLYVSTFDGFYVSEDGGITWTNFCGPELEHDTRFFVAGDTIFAGDYDGNLWINPTGQQVMEISSISPTSITINRSICDGPPRINASFSFTTSCKFADTVTGTLTIDDGTSLVLPKMRVTNGRYTIDLTLSNALTVGRHTGMITIILTGGFGRIERQIPITFLITNPLIARVVPTELTKHYSSCVPFRDTFSIASLCTNMQLVSLRVGDPTLISAKASKLVPTIITPADSVFIYIEEQPGFRSAFQTTVTATLRKDTIVTTRTITVNSTRDIEPATGFSQTQLFVNSGCRKLDSLFTFTNASCDSITINSISPVEPSFVVVTPATLPVTCPRDSSIGIRLRSSFATDGIFNCHLNIGYTFRGKTYDTVITIMLNVTGKDVNALKLFQPGINFGQVSVCRDRTLPVSFLSLACSAVSIDSIVLHDVAGAFRLTPTGAPYLSEPDTVHSLSVMFAPPAAKTFTSHLTIFFSRDGKQYDTTLTLTGVGIENGSAELMRNELAFPTTPICTDAKLSTMIQGFACDTLIVTVVQPLMVPQFSLLTPIPPVLAIGDSISVEVLFKPDVAGSYSDDLVITVRSKTGRIDTLRLHVKGNAGNGTVMPTYEPVVDAGTITICERKDTAFSITNSSTCDAMTVTGLRWSGDADFSIDGSNLPLLVAPGKTVQVAVSIDPTAEGARGGVLVVEVKNDVSSHTDSIALGVLVTAAEKKLSSDLASIGFGSLSVCELRDTVVVLTNRGCDKLTVSSCDVAGSGFAVDPSLFPIELAQGKSISIPITSVLDTAGGNPGSTATITFASNASRPLAPITVTRGYIYPSMYSITLDTIASAGSGATAALRVGIEGNVSGLETIDLPMTYNTDLLEYTGSAGPNVVSINGNVISISGNPEIVVQPDGTIAELQFLVYLTKDSVTEITVGDIRLNAASPAYEECVAWAVAGSSNFNHRLVCGESTLRGVMSGRNIFLNEIVPNPATENVTVHFTATAVCEVTIEVFDGVGREVQHTTVTAVSGRNEQVLRLGKMLTGMFTVRLNTDAGTAVGRFVKE